MSGIVVLGSINVDLVVRTPHLPQPGETVLGGEFLRASGGKGANQAVAAARCSEQPVTFIAAVGDDPFGRETQALLESENLDGRFLKVVPVSATGVALIAVDEHGENAISVASGANAHLRPEDIAAVPDEVFEQSSVFLTCLESPLETVEAGLRRARDFGLTTILDPAPATREVLDSGILEFVDLLTPNELEAAMLARVSGDDLEVAGRKLLEHGSKAIILTRGSDGVLLVDANRATSIPAHQVDVIDSTAAGDCFNGALAVALVGGGDLVEACQWASAAAAISVTRAGAQPSLPNAVEVEEFLRSRA